jgi:hypothetical protein
MKKLEESDIIQIMREEWDAKVAKLIESTNAVLKGKVDGRETLLIDPELKLRHKKSQYLYTVSSVSPRDVILRSPEGDEFLVDKEELEQNYELD